MLRPKSSPRMSPREPPPPVPIATSTTATLLYSTNPFGEPEMDEDDEEHYRVPGPDPRKVSNPQIHLHQSHPGLLNPRDGAGRVSESSSIVNAALKGLGSADSLMIKASGKTCRGRMTFKVLANGGETVASAIEEGFSRQLGFRRLISCGGGGGRRQRQPEVVIDDASSDQAFCLRRHFDAPSSCSKSYSVYAGVDEVPIGKIVAERKSLTPTLTAFAISSNEEVLENELFQVKGPKSLLLMKRGQMKFYGAKVNANGKRVNMGMIRREEEGEGGAVVIFGLGTREDRLSKVMMLAAAFLVELLYYNHQPVNRLNGD